MRRFKGSLEVFFIIALALLLLLGLFIAGLMHRASLVSYKERIDLAIILDNAGQSELLITDSFNREVCKTMEQFFSKLHNAYYSTPLPE